MPTSKSAADETQVYKEFAVTSLRATGALTITLVTGAAGVLECRAHRTVGLLFTTTKGNATSVDILPRVSVDGTNYFSASVSEAPSSGASVSAGDLLTYATDGSYAVIVDTRAWSYVAIQAKVTGADPTGSDLVVDAAGGM